MGSNKHEMRMENKKPDKVTKDELLAALRDAHKDIMDLQNQVAEYRWIEEALRKRTRELSERVKELDCLYSISDSLRQNKPSLEQVLDDIVNIIPKGYQNPALTSTRLTVAGQVFCSKYFRKTPYQRSADIQVQGVHVGIIQVFVSPSPDSADSSLFLPEEESLLKVLSVLIGEIIEHGRHLLAEPPKPNQ
jgi:nitrate/nitrite-specific signal transduction histidine kinase